MAGDSIFMVTFMNSHSLKIDVVKFDGKKNFGMWRCEVMDALTASNLQGRSRSWDQTLPQAQFAHNNTVHDSKDVHEEVQLKIEKTNKKYKVTAEKKRREKLFEEEDMMIYFKKERIPT